MKRSLVKVCLVLISTVFVTAYALAEARPVWVVAHACNDRLSLKNAIADGACGVEIDINSDKDSCLTDWSVNHDTGYMGPKTRKFHSAFRSKDGAYLSLKEYLNLPEMDQISILFLDVKNSSNDYNYPTNLVKHVHAILEARYGKGNKPPYSIIYAFYKQSCLEIQTTEPSAQGGSKTMSSLEWFRDNLWQNEGINLAWECKEKTRFSFSGFIDNIESLMEKANYPAYKHFMTHGYHESKWTSANGENVKSTQYAQQLRQQGKYCSRVGFWTCTRYKDAKWFIDPDINKRNVQCDLVLVECRNNFVFGSSKTLKELTSLYFNSNGEDYKKYNKGRFRIANQRDVFYDLNMMGK